MTRPRLFRLLPALAALTMLGMARPPGNSSPTATPNPEPTVAPVPAPAALVLPADPRSFHDAPAALGMKIEGGEDTEDGANNGLSATTELAVQFPEAMVASDRIDADDSESPVTLWPDLNARWIWRTQSQGTWTADGPVIPAQTYRVRLRPDLKTLAGEPPDADKWGYALVTRPLTVTTDYGPDGPISARPQVPLEFNYPIRLADAAAGCWFQDRLTRERFPAEILLNRASADAEGDVVDVSSADFPAPTDFRVRPRAPLPVTRFYDLVVDDVRDDYAGRPLPHPRVFALGRTAPLRVEYVVARNAPREKPHLEVKFRGLLADTPLPADALTIEPPVANLRFRREREFLFADGDFDPALRYRVTVSAGIQGDRGYPLEKAEVWGATFRPKPATLTFPAGTIRQRASLGLRFALLQANTGPVTWRLSRVPLNRLPEIRAALEARRPVSAAALELEAVASGELPASADDAEVVRPVEWKPPAGAPALSGPYLVAASTKNSAGETVENAALVFFNETVFTQKTTPAGTVLRLAGMADGRPVAAASVKILTAELDEIAQGVTDAQGTVAFPTASLVGGVFFVADLPTGPAIESTEPGSPFAGTGYSGTFLRPPYLGEIITDRPLYRPGDKVHFKGFLRVNEESPTIPKNAAVSWQILSNGRDERVAEGTAPVNAFGGWDAAWTAPAQGRLGQFRIVAHIEETAAGHAASFRIEEFRNPPFSVVCEPSPARAEAPAVSTVEVASEYFHGAPNVGSRVKWTATWISDSDGEYYTDSDSEGFTSVDLYSEQRRTPAFEAEVNGEASLDERGRVTLSCRAPFRDPGLRARCFVNWRVDVTGPDGQTITGGASEQVVMNEITLGVRPDSSTGRTDIAFDLQALPRNPASPPAAEVNAALFLVQTKSVKERLAPFVYRYRNTDVYVPVEEKNVPANGRIAFQPKTPGRYVLVVKPLAGQPGIPVSEEIYLSGESEAELPVKTDQTLNIQPVDKDKPVPVGATAAFDVQSPSPGIAWVTVETDRILDTFTIPFPGNATRIEIPVKPNYAPNVHVSAYLLRPGNSAELPGEMFGSTPLNVVQTDAELAVTVTSDRPEYKPRQPGTVTVRVTAEGRPVANAEVTLSAVDDAILTLGGWSLPRLAGTFQPGHPFSVVTRLALVNYVESIAEASLTQKGFVVGGGGKDEYGSTRFVRKDFRPLIFWRPSLTTGADGVARTTFTTPDNLTRFRVAAIAQTTANQFGSGDSTFVVSKPLLVEPALPRFLRQGDEIELRAVARQKSSPEERLTVSCHVGDGLTLTDSAPVELAAGRNDPAVATFRARVGPDATSAAIRFAVKSASGAADEVEVTIPVAPRTIEVNENVSGSWKEGTFAAGRAAPAAWRETPGTAGVTLSTSPYLPLLLGIPTTLEYPFGCFEQKSSRLLVYTGLARLLAYLPVPADRGKNYRHVIAETLREFETSLLPDDLLPYWPFGTEGNVFVTIQTAWAVAQVIQAGYDVPENLADSLPRALRAIILRETRLEVDPTLRAFALFALSQLGETPADEITTAANDLFLGRDRLTDEGRAFLIIALHAWNLEPDHQQKLVREIPENFADRPFNPRTFSSASRAEAICTWARLLAAPDADPRRLRAQLEERMKNASSLSTQENLWLLVAFNALLSAEPPAALPSRLAPPADAVSANRSAAAWVAQNLAALDELTIRAGKGSGSFVLAARRTLSPEEQRPVSRGMRIDRIVKNLTDPARVGTAEAPFRLGDQVLISFRFHADNGQDFVALEDPLPAGLEVLNPNLEMVARFYQIPAEPGVPTAWLSFSEMRDRQTNLFFDRLAAGPQAYAVLARATSAGTFAWPSAQISPMYDARFHARSAPSQCVVVSP